MSTTQPPAARATKSGEGAARVAQSALLREVPAAVAAWQLATRYVSAAGEARVGGTCSRSSPTGGARAGSSEPRAARDCRRRGWPASR
jgi:hypothetical protein